VAQSYLVVRAVSCRTCERPSGPSPYAGSPPSNIGRVVSDARAVAGSAGGGGGRSSEAAVVRPAVVGSGAYGSYASPDPQLPPRAQVPRSYSDMPVGRYGSVAAPSPYVRHHARDVAAAIESVEALPRVPPSYRAAEQTPSARSSLPGGSPGTGRGAGVNPVSGYGPPRYRAPAVLPSVAEDSYVKPSYDRPRGSGINLPPPPNPQYGGAGGPYYRERWGKDDGLSAAVVGRASRAGSIASGYRLGQGSVASSRAGSVNPEWWG
jgi:hypothetical protein